MKDANVKPLSYNFDLKRLTQLFGRPLQMKYYNIQQNPIQTIKKLKVEEPEKIINEEGEVINNDQEMSDGGGHQEDIGIDDLVEPENVVIGFEDNPMPLEGPLA